jgi:hypothetical protein
VGAAVRLEVMLEEGYEGPHISYAIAEDLSLDKPFEVIGLKEGRRRIRTLAGIAVTG